MPKPYTVFAVLASYRFTKPCSKPVGSSQFNFSTAFSHYGRALTLNFEKRKGAGEYFDLEVLRFMP